MIDAGFASTQRIGLLGAGVTQHPHFDALLEEDDGYDAMRMSIGSERTNTLSKNLVDALDKCGSR